MAEKIADGGAHDNKPRDPRFCEFEVVFHLCKARRSGRFERTGTVKATLSVYSFLFDKNVRIVTAEGEGGGKPVPFWYWGWFTAIPRSNHVCEDKSITLDNLAGGRSNGAGEHGSVMNERVELAVLSAWVNIFREIYEQGFVKLAAGE